MPNTQYEQLPIDSFVSALRHVRDRNLPTRHIDNQSCHSRTLADVEFTAISGVRWAIEAKYGAPNNRPNEVHKLFGDLLRETRCDRPENREIGLLLHRATENDFRNGVARIDRQKFIRFGCLIPVAAVFVVSPPDVIRKTWAEFYDGNAGRAIR